MLALRSLSASTARRLLAGGYSWGRRLGFYNPGAAPIRYVAEKADWSISHDARAYACAIEQRHPGTIQAIDRPELATGKITHFGSQFIWQAWNDALDSQTRRLVTYFHGKLEDGAEMSRHIAYFLDHLDQLERVVTAASCIERRLLKWGVPREKLLRVPLGVDLECFRPPSPDEKAAARQFFGVPKNHICIGSFQKDGTGWGDGMEPKLIKGPDIFVDTVTRLSKHFPIFVLLTGPARGYVKGRLEAAGISYAHRLFSQADMVSHAFRAIDLYIVASREEGGPKSVLESLACGVPLISTRVGMAEDVVQDGLNGCLVGMPEACLLAERAAEILANADLAKQLSAKGLNDIKSFAWDVVAEQLYQLAYKDLLED